MFFSGGMCTVDSLLLGYPDVDGVAVDAFFLDFAECRYALRMRLGCKTWETIAVFFKDDKSVRIMIKRADLVRRSALFIVQI